MAENENTPVFNIERIYVKNASLEVPHAPEAFRWKINNGQPQTEIKLSVSGKKIVENEPFYDITLSVTVTTVLPDKQVLFLVEVDQCGVFHIENIPGDGIEGFINVVCPEILFPYARETISDLVNRTGFPPVYLSPINFDAMYRQQFEQAEKNQ